MWTEGSPSLRQAITAATHQVDQLLANDPENEGESRDEGARVVFVFPLAVGYEIDKPKGIVRVMRVRSFRWRN